MSEIQVDAIAIDYPVSLGHPTGLHIETRSGRLDDALREMLAWAYSWGQDHMEYNEDAPFMEISLECGGNLIIPTISDFPETDVPCTCGDPAGYLIKYEKMEGE